MSDTTNTEEKLEAQSGESASDEKVLDDPTNRIVAVFDTLQRANAARDELQQHGVPRDHIRILRGSETAEQVDTSAKWFADTDDEIKRYQRELRAGSTVASIPVHDGASRETIHAILKQHKARLITHFGRWVTEMMK